MDELMLESKIQSDVEALYWWCCPDCGFLSQRDVLSIAIIGRPVCKCGTDMKLADYCEGCGRVFEQGDIDGGRCLGCGTMITQKY